MQSPVRPHAPAHDAVHPGPPPHVDPDEALRRLPVPGSTGGSPLGLVAEIVVGVEGSDREYVAQQWAAGFAAMLGVRVRGVHVRPPGGQAPRGVFRYLEEECRRWSVPFEGHVLEGLEPSEEIVAEAGPRDLLILGTRRLAGRGVLGSIARAVLARAPCPVLLVRLPQ